MCSSFIQVIVETANVGFVHVGNGLYFVVVAPKIDVREEEVPTGMVRSGQV